MRKIIPNKRYHISESEIQTSEKWTYFSVLIRIKNKAIQAIGITEKKYKIETPEKTIDIRTKIVQKENIKPYKMLHTGPMDSLIYARDLR